LVSVNLSAGVLFRPAAVAAGKLLNILDKMV
jgi:hypothetical protein